jgi:hypothetical protein
MANYYTVYFSDNGVPKTGLSPVWSTLKDITTGSDQTQPTIAEVGGGWYRFPISLTPFQNWVGVVDGTSSVPNSAERYIPVNVRFSDFSVDQDRVEMNSVYDEDTDTITFAMFVSLNGSILQSELTSFQVQLYDENGLLLFTTSTTTHTNGFALLTQNAPGLVKNRTYQGVLTVVTTNGTIIGGETFITVE